MLSTKLIIYSWISFCIFHWNELYILSVAGSPANSIQLATGEWDVKIGGGFWMDASRIFPPVTSPNSAKRITQSKGKSNFSTTKPFVKRRPWGASMDCILSLASDGTFVLTPKFVINDQGNNPSPKEEYTTTSHDLNNRTSGRNAGVKNSLLDLRGSWKVLANPYCVTDRFFDEVFLRSYPRQRMGTLKGGNDGIGTEEKVLETIQWTLKCRLWGRHNLQKHERSGYRFTHGSLFCADRDISRRKPFFSPIMGSFSAYKKANTPRHEGWIDKERFGYSTE